MEDQKSKVTEFRNIIEDILQSKFNVVKLNVVEFFSLFFASIASMILVATCIVLAMIFGAVALALFLNSVLDSVFVGFLIVSGFFLFGFVVLVWSTSKKRVPIFTDTFVRLFVGLFYDDNEKD